MRMVVESFQRLYKKGRVTKQQVRDRVANGLFTEDEYKFITGEVYVPDEEIEN